MRIAVLGCGSIGRRHLRNLAILGEKDLLAFDPDPVAIKGAWEVANVRCCGDLREVWEQYPQVAIVAAPTNLHVDLALEAARQGCHIFIEKPLSHSMDGIDTLLREVERRGLVTMVACNMRFHPGPAAVKRLLEKGAVGQVIAARVSTGSYLPRWRPWQDYRRSYSASPEWGGAMLDCIHEVDLALWYFGPAVVAGAASLPATVIGLETDGVAEILLRHVSGVLCNVHLNFVQRDYRRACEIIGSEGSIYWDFRERRVAVFGADGELAKVLPEPAGWDMNQMYLDEMSHFLEAVRTGSSTMNPLSGGLAALEIVLAAKRCQGGMPA